MGIDARTFELIDGIYDAAVEPWQWRKLLDQWRREFRAKQVLFAYLDLTKAEAGVDISVGIDGEGAERFARYSRQNPFLRAAAATLRVGRVVHGEMLLPLEELRQTEYYRAVLEPEGVLYTGGPVLFQNDSMFSLLIARRDPRAGRFTDAELELQQRLTPHLQRALQLHWRLLGAEGRNAGLLEAIGSLRTAVMLINSVGQVIDLNRPARAILDRRDGLRLGTRGAIEVEHGIGDRALAPLIDGAVNTGRGVGSHPGGAITVARRGNRMPYTLLVTPIRTRDFVREYEQPVAAVFITDPDAIVAPGELALRSLYGLTPTETALARRLTDGLSVNEAADEMGISKNTVRTHLKRIFSKTGTRRQGELVSLLLRGAPRISA